MDPIELTNAGFPLRKNNTALLTYWVGFWLVTCVGIAAAGGLFGLFFGFIAGLVFGMLFAAVFAIPIVIVVGVFTWAFWLNRFAVLLTAVAGAMTGVISTMCLFGNDDPVPAIFAGLIGAATPPWFAYAYQMWRRDYFIDAGGVANVWQYSLSDLFVRFTAVTLLIAFVSLLAATISPR